ncbi:MAG: glycosyltransferase family 2 protein [Patescibacteria group bacterium]
MKYHPSSLRSVSPPRLGGDKGVVLSVVLATRNEGAVLKRCLDSVKDIADEIVIADERSTDDTQRIAKQYGARIIEVDHNDNFHITKNIAIDAARGDWILQLDADEVVPPELANEIKQIILSTSHLVLSTNGYWINRRNWFLNRFLTKGGQYPDSTIRLYRKGLGRLPARDVHEQAKVTGPVGHLTHDLLHYRDTSFEKYLDGFNRYSTFISSQMAGRKLSINIFQAVNYLVIRPFWTFFLIYFRHLGLVDGLAGFIFALFSGLIHPVAYIKYWQRTLYPDTTPQSPPRLGGETRREGRY